MNDKVFLDTNVLIYVLGQKDERTEAAEALIAGGFVVSVQVLNELVAVARRKLGMTWQDIGEAVTAIRTLCSPPVPLTIATHEAAIRIAAQYGYHIYDAMIVASALEADCVTLYSEDLQDGRVIDGRLTIRNPFTRAPRVEDSRAQTPAP